MSRQPSNAVQVTRPWTWGSGTPLSQLFALPKTWYVVGTASRGLLRRHPRWTWGTVALLASCGFTGSLVGGVLLFVSVIALCLTAWIGFRRRRGAPRRGLQDLRVEDQRRRQLKRQWPTACGSAKVQRAAECGGGPPPLQRLRANPADGSFVATIDPTSTGIVAEDLAKHANRLAKVIGCKDVYVREREDGKAQLTFFWTDALGRHLALADLPFAPAGLVSYGTRADGKAATIDPRLSVIWGGQTGKGKSVATWVALADMLRQGMHVRLYISDGKVTELARFRQYVGQVNGTLDVRAYATEEGTAAMLKRVDGALKKRQEWMAERGITNLDASAENPAVIVWVDELLVLEDLLKKGSSSLLSLFAFTARAAHLAVWASAQATQMDTIGPFRRYIVQRVCFGTESPESTDAILGGQSAQRGADCHRNLKPGRGWSKNENGELEPFRAAFIRPDEQDLIAAGIVPDHVPRPAQGEETNLYRHFDGSGRLLYVGISNSYLRRSSQHESDKAWWKDITDTKVEKWTTRELAEAAEEAAIKAEHPVYNIQHASRQRRRPTLVERTSDGVRFKQRKPREPRAKVAA